MSCISKHALSFPFNNCKEPCKGLFTGTLIKPKIYGLKFFFPDLWLDQPFTIKSPLEFSKQAPPDQWNGKQNDTAAENKGYSVWRRVYNQTFQHEEQVLSSHHNAEVLPATWCSHFSLRKGSSSAIWHKTTVTWGKTTVTCGKACLLPPEWKLVSPEEKLSCYLT